MSLQRAQAYGFQRRPPFSTDKAILGKQSFIRSQQRCFNRARSSIPYSESPDSEFYKAVNEVYTISLSLTDEDIRIVKHWGDIPGNYNTPSHYTHIATQLIEENEFKLDQAAVTYAKHGIAINEALISVFKAKYMHNLIRPISYIRSVLGTHDVEYSDSNTCAS